MFANKVRPRTRKVIRIMLINVCYETQISYRNYGFPVLSGVMKLAWVVGDLPNNQPTNQRASFRHACFNLYTFKVYICLLI